MIIFLIILLFFQSFIPSYGINEFTTNQEISYQFNQQGISQVEHKINIKNNFSQFYPTEYNLSLSGSQATNIQAFDSNDAIPVNITKNNDEIKFFLCRHQSRKLVFPKHTTKWNRQFQGQCLLELTTLL